MHYLPIRFLLSCVGVGAFLLVPVLFALAHAEGEETARVFYIHMTDAGFEPESLEIRQGDIVVFENETSDPRWPASNIHPTHTVYPGSDIAKCDTGEAEDIFDACRGLEQDEEYPFVFTKTGRWRYHDHIEPRFTGEIIVLANENFVEEEEPIISSLSSLLSRLYTDTADFFKRAYYALFPGKLEERISDVRIFEITDDEAALREVITLTSPTVVMNKLLEEAGGGVELDCHQEAHQVGRVSFDLVGARVFEEGDASCHSGFYHGAMEAFLAKQGTEDLAVDIDELCRAFDTSFGVFECLHGVGHGVMAYEDYALFRALDACDELKDTFSARSCYGGVFMENVVAARGLGAVPGHKTEWVSAENPYFPCNEMEPGSNREFECYQMQTSWMLETVGHNFYAVSELCERAPESARQACFISMGRDIAGNTLRDPERILALCDNAPRQNNYYNSCIYGALNVIVDFWGPRLGNQAREFCALVADADTQASCYTTLERREQEIFGEVRG